MCAIICGSKKGLMSEVTVFLSLADSGTVLMLKPDYKQRRDIVFSRQRCVTLKLTKENIFVIDYFYHY